MELALITENPNLSLLAQKELYQSHPYDRDFVQQMDKVIETGHLPRFVTLSWLSWWFLQQTRYIRVVVHDEDEYGLSSILLEDHKLAITYYEEEAGNTYDIELPNKEEGYAALCDVLWIGEGEQHTPWFYADESMNFLAKAWKPQLSKEDLTVRVRGQDLDFDSVPDLFLREKAVCQAFVKDPPPSKGYNFRFVKAANDFSVNLPQLGLGGWWHEKDSRYRYFITKVGPLQFQTFFEEIAIVFEFEFIVVLEWAYEHFLGHHLDKIASYNNPKWSLEELRAYAKDAWDVEGDSRQDIIKQIKYYLEETAEWVDNLTPENL